MVLFEAENVLMSLSIGNHTAYKQWKGTKTSPEQILELYDGLKQSYLDNFDVMLSGYIPSAEAVQAVGKIGRELKLRSGTRPGSFFWGVSTITDVEWSVARVLTLSW